MQINDAQMLVLWALAEGPGHGYAINTAIEDLTGERLGPGSLYGALTRLEAKGLIEALHEQGRQQPVQLTPEGRRRLEERLRSMSTLASTGLQRLGVETGMTMARALVQLYPRVFRERWGADLAHDAAIAGPRSWLGLVTGAARMWLHPAEWPARTGGQRRSRALGLGLAATVGAWLISALTIEFDGPLHVWATRTRGYDVILASLLLGVMLVLPMPRWAVSFAAVVVRRAVCQLSAPGPGRGGGGSRCVAG